MTRILGLSGIARRLIMEMNALCVSRVCVCVCVRVCVCARVCVGVRVECVSVWSGESICLVACVHCSALSKRFGQRLF